MLPRRIDRFPEIDMMLNYPTDIPVDGVNENTIISFF